ncbi:MAG: hypothetical protein BroJett011_34010 [Chloroflexota bacterium]|nr:MAG: hypothetical protein BroJett011_34010 [Chloroflexota bacterium]
MIRGNELEERAYESEHVEQVLAEIEANFPKYFESFAQQPLAAAFKEAIREYEKEQKAYREYMSLEALAEFEYDPNAFKRQTRTQCPIIRRCLMSPNEVMKDYRASFNIVSGRQLLDTIRNIAEFGIRYVAHFSDEKHENAATYGDLGLETLNEGKYGCGGVIGYGIQSSLLYGQYPRNFALRSQNAVWSLYFLSGRKNFGLKDGSEFLMVQPKLGTCDQNFFYPAELFGFYALKLFKLLQAACQALDVTLFDHYRYIYLSRFCDHVGDTHRENIYTYTRSSEYVESQPWF